MSGEVEGIIFLPPNPPPKDPQKDPKMVSVSILPATSSTFEPFSHIPPGGFCFDVLSLSRSPTAFPEKAESRAPTDPRGGRPPLHESAT